ncbi:hypothetical protein GCU56_14720 [Geodermatophilus sabuli]|uniref:Creatinase N-terminal domain-containing protein n=1 Tax=Geodermatophilus sabuli TaxID=1564158 RepID=A0A7K3W5K9_9ACTN|nr:aminopeptidase P family N-terminal domain-containing protein [Geodermatophilus sabuli]NEK59117.1 hypothetical protein [Geodermatophilus sabuli]
MKRGLVVMDPAEIPGTEWTDRVRRLQERMSAEGLSLALVYGDVFRSDDIGYLTNLCIYWNEGIVAVPAEGEPAFLTKLSPRVHPWMKATSTVADLRSGKSFSQLTAGLVEGREPGVIGLVDAALWPATVVEQVTGAAPAWEVRLLGGIVREQRLVPSAAELALLRDGARSLGRAMDQATGSGGQPAEAVAVLEGEVRSAGFTDLMTEVSRTSDGVVSLEVTGEYRHGWLHAGRILDPSSPEPHWLPTLRAGFEAAVGAVDGAARFSDVTAAAEAVLGDLPADAAWYVRCVNQADMATNGEYESVSPTTPLPDGAVVVVGIEVVFADGGRAAVAETVLVGPHGAERIAVSGQPAPTDLEEASA